MTLLVHQEKYAVTSHLSSPLVWPDMQVEHRRIEPGSMQPVTFSCNSVAVALAGRTPVSRTANGLQQRTVIRPGMAAIEPVGFHESEAEIASPLDCLHIYLEPGLVGSSALTDFDLDPAKARLAYAGGLIDPLLNQIAIAFHGIVVRGVEPVDSLLIDGMRSVLTWHLLTKYSLDRWQYQLPQPCLAYDKLKRVVDMIEGRLGEQISLRDMAGEAGLSDFHFSRLFRRAKGRSPHLFVLERRIQAAQELLAKANASLVEVALETGFGSQASFNRAFLKQVGLTPGQFRAQHSR
ncbi:helix-turn-helix domain-containing protein [Radicibacter daui]|uniref:helix-turn-helix domain-containing protein n=1 Tax=Radicibacter daui TaxID=3064829 RepID=UPI004046F407